MVAAMICAPPSVAPSSAVSPTILSNVVVATEGGTPGVTARLRTAGESWVPLRKAWREMSASRHAGLFSVNKSPDAREGSATFDSVDSCKQKPRSDRLQAAQAMKQPQPQVVRDSKDMTMSAVINRGGGRPSKGLRKYIGFRTQAKTAEDVQMIAAAKGMTVTDYVSSAVDRSLREDLALLDHFALQEELPIRIAS